MITNKDKKTLFYAAGILSVVVVYFMNAVPAAEEREALKASNEALEAELVQLRSYAEQRDYYEKETKTMQAEIDKVLSEFPAGITEETTIMYADMLETETDMHVPNISIGNSNMIYTLQGGEGDANAVSMYATPVVYTFTVSYDDMKEAIGIIQNDEDKRNVETITLSYESGSGMLVGNMTVNMYAVPREGEQYKAPEVPPMSLGTDNIFGTVTTGGSDEESGNAE